MMQNIIHAAKAQNKANSGGPTGLVMAVLASQLLLLGLAIAWCVHQVLLAKYGAIYSTEPSSTVLFAEIVGVLAISVFAISVFVVALKWYFRQSTNEDTTSDK